MDNAKSKAVFKAARKGTGLRALPEPSCGNDRLTVEIQPRFRERVYAPDGGTGLMLQALLKTGARSSELVQLRIEHVSQAVQVVTTKHGKGDRRREAPSRRDLAQMLQLHSGTRRAGPLFDSVTSAFGRDPDPALLRYVATSPPASCRRCRSTSRSAS